MLWILFERAPRPDAVVWPGRRALAALDAVAWPLALGAALLGLPQSGAAGLTALAACVYFAWRRLLCAMLRNERYFFTTWRWGRLLIAWLLLGCGLQLAGWMDRHGVLGGQV